MSGIATDSIPSWLAALGEFDADRVEALRKDWEAKGCPRTLIDYRSAKAPEPPEDKPAKALALVRDDPANPHFTRGPWLLTIEGLGRPPTANEERKSSMSPGTMAKTRRTKRDWGAAVAGAAKGAGVPPLNRAFVTVQPFYPDNRVPDTDGLAPMVKAVMDGLVTAGVLDNDRREQMPFGYHPLPPYTDGGPPRVAVTIYPLA